MLELALKLQRKLFLQEKEYSEREDNGAYLMDETQEKHDVVEEFLKKEKAANDVLYFGEYIIFYDASAYACLSMDNGNLFVSPQGEKRITLVVLQATGYICIKMYDVKAVDLLVDVMKSTWLRPDTINVYDRHKQKRTVFNNYSVAECDAHVQSIRDRLAQTFPNYVINIKMEPNKMTYCHQTHPVIDPSVFAAGPPPPPIVDTKEDSGVFQCEVCWHNRKIISLPCGHVFCHSCSKDLENCPTCRSKVTHGKRRVYL